MESIESLARTDQRWHGFFDHRVDQSRLCRSGVALGGHAARDGPCAQPRTASMAKFLIATPAGRPFADHPQRTAKTGRLQPPPQFSADPAACIPFRLKGQ